VLLPTVLGFRSDIQGPWHSVHVWEAWPKNRRFMHFSVVFMSYCPQFWGSEVIYKVHDTQYRFKRHDQKLVIFVFSGHFHELLATASGFRSDLQGPWHSVHVWEAWPKTHCFCVLGPFSWAIAHSFGVPGWFIRPKKLSTFLRGVTKNSLFLHFRTVFMSYYPQFWGLGVIYKVHDTQYIFERHDQKLVIFAF
jgi:hypothetical protein